MPELLKKSNQNFSAASLLIENELYASSIHCSYYSCFQKLKNVISQANFCSYKELEEERVLLNQSLMPKKKLASHEFLINKKLGQLIIREQKDHKLISEINDLKLYRTRSDYENVAISPKEANSAFSKTIKVIDKLNELL